MQGRLNEICKCAQRICLAIGVQPNTWVQLGSINARIPYKTVIHQVRRAKTNQRDSKLESSYEPEGREFESLRAHHSSSSVIRLYATCDSDSRRVQLGTRLIFEAGITNPSPACSAQTLRNATSSSTLE